MRTIRFNAPSHHVLEVGDQTVHGGEELLVTDDVAAELLTAPYIDVTEVEGEGISTSLPRERLNELAEQAGVGNPEDLPNKDAVITAIEEAQEPEAGEGEGSED